MQNAVSGLKSRLEYPFEGTRIEGKTMLVGGWAFMPDGEELKVNVYIDGKPSGSCKWGAARYDVFKEFGSESAYESGFFGNIKVGNLDKGTHEVEVRVLCNGAEVSVGKTKIVQPAWYTLKRKPAGEYQFKYLENAMLPIGHVADSAKRSGARMFNAFMDMCDLPKKSDILDVGCGMGRFSLPFIRYVGDEGSYAGLELMPPSVKYLEDNFVARFPNFTVKRVEVFNDLYNPDCNVKASEYVFPFENDSFDMVFLQSVFTHMVTQDVTNYLRQMHRVLRPGGLCMITYFLIDEHSKRMISEKKTNRSFSFKHDHFWSDTEEIIEIAIAYDAEWLKATYEEIGFEIESIHKGTWRGETGTTGQDVVVARKKR
ncbi:MAG: methyltransferase domain-containing protein [Pseudodesulfovibrio sp.]|uniref:class I SAM-dependent methyltransferase n=1 Tax=Pseudodesulfovibrio sp. TaxID=2035812 RepID=UPI003D0BA1E7